MAGGKREGAGRPRLFSPDATRLSITIEPEHAARLQELGGSVSAGLRMVMEARDIQAETIRRLRFALKEVRRDPGLQKANIALIDRAMRVGATQEARDG